MSRRLVIIGLSLILLLAATGTSGASSSSSATQDTTVLDWNRHAVEALINMPAAPVPGAGQTPPVSLLHLAMVQRAVYDAVNMIHRGYEPYLDDLPRAPRWASKRAAVATAAHHVLAGLGIAPVPPLAPGVITRLDGLYADALAGIPNGGAKRAGIAAGAAAAQAMLEERSGDGRYVPFSFAVGEIWVNGSPPAGSTTHLQTATAMFFTANPVELYNRTFRTIAQDRDLTWSSRPDSSPV